VLLISDGARDGGRRTPQAAAARARALHVPVYTILLGTPSGVVQHTLPGGYNEILRVPASAQTLQQIARISGGEFFTASNDKRLGEVYDQLRSRLGHKKQSREITDIFAGGSALLLAVSGALSAFWFRRVP
jgi:Ca-activated chloride channel family protein